MFRRLAGVSTAVLGLGLFGVLPASAAPYDGDWEGDLRCEAAAGMPAVYEPVLASVLGEDIKMLRGPDIAGDVIPGKIAADGQTRISGRARLADGAVTYLSLAGRFAPGRFEGDGTAVPESGGALRACTLVMQAAIAARGEGVAVAVDPYPSANPGVVYGTGVFYGGAYPFVTWHSSNYWWRQEMMRRWQWRMWEREQGIRRYCEQHPRACGHAAIHPPPPRPLPPRDRDPPPLVDKGAIMPGVQRGPAANQQGPVTVIRPGTSVAPPDGTASPGSGLPPGTRRPETVGPQGKDAFTVPPTAPRPRPQPLPSPGTSGNVAPPPSQAPASGFAPGMQRPSSVQPTPQPPPLQPQQQQRREQQQQQQQQQQQSDPRAKCVPGMRC